MSQHARVYRGAAGFEHVRRGDVVDGAADSVLCVGVEVGEGGEFLPALLVGERIREDGVLGHFGEADVAPRVVEIGAVILPHEEELAAVAEDGGADAAFLEARVLLHDGDIPAVDLPHLPALDSTRSVP